MKIIATHIQPDLDAIGAVFAAEVAGLIQVGKYAVVFVPAGQTDPAADFVFDTGREYDPERGRFDHHHDATLPSATMLVAQEMPNVTNNPIYPLFRLISNADLGVRFAEVTVSNTLGIHALFNSFKAEARRTDQQLFDYGMALLRSIASRLNAEVAAKAELGLKATWHEGKATICSIVNGSPLSTQAAFEAGADLVVFYNDQIEGTVTIGLQRAPETNWRCNHIVEMVMQKTRNDNLRAELATWFRHESGFVALRGSGKNPDPRPLQVSPHVIAEAILAAMA